MVKIFDGLVFCITGKLSKTRKEIEKSIESRGGRVVDSVSGNVDYVISEKNELKKNTNKILDAKAKLVPILKEKYLDDSIKANRALPYKKYTLVAPGDSDEDDSDDDESYTSTQSKKAKTTKKKAAPKPKKPTKEEEDDEDEEEDDDDEEVTWYWKDDKGWTPYSEVISYKLEAGYHKNKAKTVKVDKEREVDFKAMVQRRMDDYNKKRDVKREVKKTTKKRKAPVEEKTTKKSKKAKVDDDEDGPALYVPMNCFANEWTSSNPDEFETPIQHDKLHYGFDKSVSNGSKLAQKWEKQMKDYPLGSESEYPWFPFVVRIPEKWEGKSVQDIMNAALLEMDAENSDGFTYEKFKKATDNFFTYNPNDPDDDDEGEDTKIETSKDMKKHLTDIFNYEYTGDEIIAVFPKFVGGFMKDDSSKIVGLFSIKVQT
eukprot:Phypoly_transcript_10068.p1 GENE.Phypoly_transcript_10068~~Phypoly_transcript_10068.p1  ORF type:complete len:429 (+),score=105.14 Phypoly_transcript_10068:14-1300(+)